MEMMLNNEDQSEATRMNKGQSRKGRAECGGGGEGIVEAWERKIKYIKATTGCMAVVERKR